MKKSNKLNESYHDYDDSFEGGIRNTRSGPLVHSEIALDPYGPYNQQKPIVCTIRL